MKNAFAILFFLLIGVVNGQVGNVFPNVETETVDGKTVGLPAYFKGKYTLVGIGTSKKAEEDLRSWQTPIYNKFIQKTGFMDQLYDVNICFLPLFTGASRMAKDRVVKRLKENNEKLVIDHVYIYAGNREPFKALGIDDKADPYFLLLDAQGKVVWAITGRFRAKYLEQIEDILTQ